MPHDYEREACKEKDSQGDHRVWASDTSRSIVCLVLLRSHKRVVRVQLLSCSAWSFTCSFGNFGGRGKKISKIFPGHCRSREARRRYRARIASRKIEEMNLAEKGSELEKR